MDPERQRISSSEYRAKAQRGETDSDVVVCHLLAAEEIKQLDGSESFSFVLSTGEVDRDRDIVEPKGGDLTAFRKNPVVLWSHDAFAPPVGVVTEIDIKGKRILETMRFLVEANPMAVMLRDILVSRRELKALDDKGGAKSIGFLPRKAAFNEQRRGVDFMEWEMLESSLVNIPANASALARAKALGIDVEPMAEWCQRALHSTRGGVWLDSPRALAILEACGEETRGLKLFELGAEELKAAIGRPAEITDPETETLHAITYDEAHEGGTPKAPRDEAWAAVIAESKSCAAWSDGTHRFCHHRPEGRNAVVFRGVATAATQLAADAEITPGDAEAVREHLGKHYEEFGEEAPWVRDARAWAAFGKAARVAKATTAQATIPLLVAAGLQLEADALEGVIEEPHKIATGDPPAVEEKSEDNEIDLGDLLADEEVQRSLAKELQKAFLATTGALPT